MLSILALMIAALVCAGGASAKSLWIQVTITASDSTPLACAYTIPSGTAPAGGWPGVILFHGLGQSHTDVEPIGAALSEFGFAALACDARGTGGSGGKFGLDGPTEVQDARDLYNWMSARSDVSNTQIGAFGLSLGGGEVWNSAVAGVPWKAIVPAITWTKLSTALNPDNVPKTGLLGILSQAVPLSNWDTPLAQVAQTLLQGSVTQSVTDAEASRSPSAALHSLTVPTLMLQGRHDFLFDIDQALAAYKRLAGPKLLYIGDLGHPPATNPTAEQTTYVLEAAAWFAHYLAGVGSAFKNGIQMGHDPYDGSTTSFNNTPPARTVVVSLPGSSTLSSSTAAVRSVKLTGGPHETFGDSFLTVHYSGASNWTHLVATVSVKGASAPVTEGAAPISTASGTVKIPLMDEAVLLPRGKKLVITLGATSADNVYKLQPPVPTWASPAPQGASIKLGRASLKLSVLKKTISR